MARYKLNNMDPEDIEDFLKKVETSFDIEFKGNELAHITTFGGLCDHISANIHLDPANDCTSQQAFYKFRNALSSTLQVDPATISPALLLTDFLPRPGRRAMMKKIEQQLGFSIHLLRPPNWVTGLLAMILLAAFIGLFFNWPIGLAGLLFSIIAIQLAQHFGNELKVVTVRQVAEKMTRESYLKSRRDPKTFNKREVETVLMEWFCIDFGLERKELLHALAHQTNHHGQNPNSRSRI